MVNFWVIRNARFFAQSEPGKTTFRPIVPLCFIQMEEAAGLKLEEISSEHGFGEIYPRSALSPIRTFEWGGN